jgi:hypothetical protein
MARWFWSQSDSQAWRTDRRPVRTPASARRHPPARRQHVDAVHRMGRGPLTAGVVAPGRRVRKPTGASPAGRTCSWAGSASSPPASPPRSCPRCGPRHARIVRAGRPRGRSWRPAPPAPRRRRGWRGGSCSEEPSADFFGGRRARRAGYAAVHSRRRLFPPPSANNATGPGPFDLRTRAFFIRGLLRPRTPIPNHLRSLSQIIGNRVAAASIPAAGGGHACGGGLWRQVVFAIAPRTAPLTSYLRGDA